MALLLATGLASCGGGGTSAPAAGGGNVSITSTTATFSSRVVDSSNGNPLPNATVTLATSSGAITATTDNTGNFTLAVDPSQLPTPSASSPVVLTVTVDGYQAEVQSYTSPIVVGTSYGPAAGGGATAPASVSLTRLVDGAFSPPQGALLVHLGDGIYPSDTANSQFQAHTFGLKRAIKLGSISGLDLNGYQQLTVTLSFKGLQATSCADRIGFYQSPASDGSSPRHGEQVLALIDSPADGSYGDQTLQPSIAGLDAALGELWIEVESGSCGTADQADDFELVNARARFLP